MNDTDDQQRIQFVHDRDGQEGAVNFAKQCVRVYRGAVLASKRKHRRGGVFRELYIRSYLFHKAWVENNAL